MPTGFAKRNLQNPTFFQKSNVHDLDWQFHRSTSKADREYFWVVNGSAFCPSPQLSLNLLLSYSL